MNLQNFVKRNRALLEKYKDWINWRVNPATKQWMDLNAHNIIFATSLSLFRVYHDDAVLVPGKYPAYHERDLPLVLSYHASFEAKFDQDHNQPEYAQRLARKWLSNYKPQQDNASAGYISASGCIYKQGVQQGEVLWPFLQDELVLCPLISF